MRTDPAASVPIATLAMPARVAAAAPPLEPPAVRVVSNWLRVAPCAGESVTPF